MSERRLCFAYSYTFAVYDYIVIERHSNKWRQRQQRRRWWWKSANEEQENICERRTETQSDREKEKESSVHMKRVNIDPFFIRIIRTLSFLLYVCAREFFLTQLLHSLFSRAKSLSWCNLKFMYNTRKLEKKSAEKLLTLAGGRHTNNANTFAHTATHT